MKLLHICSYYIGNELYMNMMSEISKKNIEQYIYIPIKSKKNSKKNQIDPIPNNINYYYNNILKPYDRIFYFNKIKKQMINIENMIINKESFSFIHAHTIFSDGGTAYELYKKYGIKYLVNVRNTDINIFYKYGIHLRKYMYKILMNAEKVVFVSYAYKIKTEKILPEKILNKVKEKFVVIPNGVDKFWHKNKKNEVKSMNETIKLLSIGKVNKNKNISNVIKVCNELNQKGLKCTLDVIGDGPKLKKCREMVNELDLNDQVTFYRYIKDRYKIVNIMQESNIFILISYKETFGLVYPEAMSQGLPVIYTKNQGIAGFFREGEVGYAVNPNDKKEVVSSIIKVIENIEEISMNCLKNTDIFKWEKIVENYIDIYLESKSILKDKG